jgi:hypothetical protein
VVLRRPGAQRRWSRRLRPCRADLPRRPPPPHPRNHPRPPRPARPAIPADRSGRPGRPSRDPAPRPGRQLPPRPARGPAAPCSREPGAPYSAGPTRVRSPRRSRPEHPAGSPRRRAPARPTHRASLPGTAAGANPTPAEAAADHPTADRGLSSARPVPGRVPAAAFVDFPRLRHATVTVVDFPSSPDLTADRPRGHGAGWPVARPGPYATVCRPEPERGRAICRIDPDFSGRGRSGLRKAHSRGAAPGYRFPSRVEARTRRRARDRSVNLASPRAPPRSRRQT